MWISDVKVGENYKGVLEIRDIYEGETKTGKPYIFITAGDKTGNFKIKFWNVNDELREALELYGLEDFLEVYDLEVGEYNGEKELTARSLDSVVFVKREEIEARLDFNRGDYSLGAPISKDTMYGEIVEKIEAMENKDISRLVLRVLEDFGEDFKEAPASTRVHHDYKGGLLFHSYNMLRVAEAIHPLYSFVNRDLIYAGVILHDMGKVVEYKKESGRYLKEFSVDGSLLGHISIMSSLVLNYGQELGTDPEVIMNIQHLILSHHGELEWGSPVKPKTPEAIMLHYIDNLDSKMEMVRYNLTGLNKGEFTDRIFGLGNVGVYFPDIDA